MAKKKIENPANKLNLRKSFLEGSGQAPKSDGKDPSENDTPRQSSSNTDYSWERFAFICDKTLVAKVKAIATKEDITIRELMEYMMTQGITRYEKKNGAVDTGIETSGKKRLKDIM